MSTDPAKAADAVVEPDRMEPFRQLLQGLPRDACYDTEVEPTIELAQQLYTKATSDGADGSVALADEDTGHPGYYVLENTVFDPERPELRAALEAALLNPKTGETGLSFEDRDGTTYFVVKHGDEAEVSDEAASPES